MGRPIIQVDGTIGAGKTYYIQHVLLPVLLSAGFRVLVINEPVDLWTEILPLLYQDPTRNAYLFETKAFVDRIRTINAALARTDVDIFVCERGILSQAIFVDILKARGNLSDVEFKTYLDWSSTWTELVKEHPTHIIYIQTELDVCMTRIRRRNRLGESDLSRDYVRELIEAHNRRYLESPSFLITGTTSAEVILIDFSRDVVEVESYQTTILSQLMTAPLAITA
jgi:deoxyadenosine/deoxycytidine kinase